MRMQQNEKEKRKLKWGDRRDWKKNKTKPILRFFSGRRESPSLVIKNYCPVRPCSQWQLSLRSPFRLQYRCHGWKDSLHVVSALRSHHEGWVLKLKLNTKQHIFTMNYHNKTEGSFSPSVQMMATQILTIDAFDAIHDRLTSFAIMGVVDWVKALVLLPWRRQRRQK